MAQLGAGLLARIDKIEESVKRRGAAGECDLSSFRRIFHAAQEECDDQRAVSLFLHLRSVGLVKDLEVATRKDQPDEARTKSNFLVGASSPWDVSTLELYGHFGKDGCHSNRFCRNLKRIAQCGRLDNFSAVLARLGQQQQARKSSVKSTKAPKEWRVSDASRLLFELDPAAVQEDESPKCRRSGDTLKHKLVKKATKARSPSTDPIARDDDRLFAPSPLTSGQQSSTTSSNDYSSSSDNEGRFVDSRPGRKRRRTAHSRLSPNSGSGASRDETVARDENVPIKVESEDADWLAILRGNVDLPLGLVDTLTEVVNPNPAKWLITTAVDIPDEELINRSTYTSILHDAPRGQYNSIIIPVRYGISDWARIVFSVLRRKFTLSARPKVYRMSESLGSGSMRCLLRAIDDFLGTSSVCSESGPGTTAVNVVASILMGSNSGDPAAVTLDDSGLRRLYVAAISARAADLPHAAQRVQELVRETAASQKDNKLMFDALPADDPIRNMLQLRASLPRAYLVARSFACILHAKTIDTWSPLRDNMRSAFAEQTRIIEEGRASQRWLELFDGFNDSIHLAQESIEEANRALANMKELGPVVEKLDTLLVRVDIEMAAAEHRSRVQTTEILLRSARMEAWARMLRALDEDLDNHEAKCQSLDAAANRLLLNIGEMRDLIGAEF